MLGRQSDMVKNLEEIDDEIQRLKSITDQIPLSLREDKLSREEQLAGAVKKVNLIERIDSLLWVRGNPSKEWTNFREDQNYKLIEIIRDLKRYFSKN